MQRDEQDDGAARWAELRCSVCGNIGVRVVKPGADREARRAGKLSIVRAGPWPTYWCIRCWKRKYGQPD